MPKGGNAGGDGNDKIRFIMLEANLSSGNFSQITQAIAQALRPSVVAPTQRVIAAPPTKNGSAPEIETEVEVDESLVEDSAETQSSASNASRKPSVARQYREPKRLDVDITAFKDFAAAKSPPDQATTRHLVAAVWFKHFFKTPQVTVDHVYSAYLEAGWSTNMDDFDLPFRKLVSGKKGLMKRVERGSYEATFPGLNAVRQMGQAVPEPDAST